MGSVASSTAPMETFFLLKISPSMFSSSPSGPPHSCSSKVTYCVMIVPTAAGTLMASTAPLSLGSPRCSSSRSALGQAVGWALTGLSLQACRGGKFDYGVDSDTTDGPVDMASKEVCMATRPCVYSMHGIVDVTTSAVGDEGSNVWGLYWYAHCVMWGCPSV